MAKIQQFISYLLIFTFTLMIVEKCVFVEDKHSILAFFYELEDDLESKREKSDIKKDTDKFHTVGIGKIAFLNPETTTVHGAFNIDFEEGHPSQPDLPPEI